jgi:hypothetical protein
MAIKKIFLFLLSAVIGLVFILSAYSKLYPIEPFEFTFVDLGVAGWRLAPFVARLFISLEFLLGALFLFSIAVKFAARTAFVILIVFTLYLTAILLTEGNTGNCGCFGNMFPMTPVQGIIKNAVLVLFTLILFKYHTGLQLKRKINLFVVLLFATLSLSLPHILNYVDIDYSRAYLAKPSGNQMLELDTLFKYAEKNVPPQSLKTGKHVIAFMSLTCPHCRLAAKKMRIMNQKNPALSFFLVLNGDDEDIKPFFADTKANNIPWCILLGKPFIYLAGTHMPAIYLVSNSVISNRVDYLELDQTEIEKWYNEK